MRQHLNVQADKNFRAKILESKTRTKVYIRHERSSLLYKLHLFRSIMIIITIAHYAIEFDYGNDCFMT